MRRLSEPDDLSMKRFGRWLVLGYAGLDNKKRCSWECSCECGTRRAVLEKYLRNGNSRSCGCARYRIKHGGASKERAPEYRVWATMKSRCLNTKDRAYKNYGGRGITVCEKWKNSYEAFIEDMGRRPSQNYSIERIDNDSGYYKENCVWGTAAEQSKNRRVAHWIEVNGRKQNVTEWARELRIRESAIIRRLYRGWSKEEAVLTPPLAKGECRKKAASEAKAKKVSAE